MPQHVDFKKREEFRIRLVRSLENAGFNPRKAGELRTLFNKRYGLGQVTSIAVYKWLMGESMPTEDKLVILAEMCGVCPYWLRYGELIKPINSIDTNNFDFNNPQQC
ncbi:MAG: hypothetical protein RLZZ189_1099 [Pseudomonadota bacterium]|jgi:hypothetical protein